MARLARLAQKSLVELWFRRGRRYRAEGSKARSGPGNNGEMGADIFSFFLYDPESVTPVLQYSSDPYASESYSHFVRRLFSVGRV